MSSYIKKIQIKDKFFQNNIFYAPLAGYTDFPFREMAQKYSPGLVMCEMVKIEALVRHDTNSFKLLDYKSLNGNVGAQLCGSNLKYVKQAARIIEDMGFDLIDLNCGCPVEKVTKDGSGSAMLKTPELIGEMLHSIISVVDIPVSVKIRSGWDQDSINALEIVDIAEEVGAQLLTIHGRTKKQGYSGLADWEIIRQCKSRAKKIKIFGNGDLFSPQAVSKMFEYTGCDGVLIARGMIGHPSFIQKVISYLDKNDYVRDAFEVKEEMLSHFDLIKRYQIEKKAVLDMRRLACWYLQRCEGAKKLRIAINSSNCTEEIYAHINQFDWGSLRYKEKLHIPR